MTTFVCICLCAFGHALNETDPGTSVEDRSLSGRVVQLLELSYLRDLCTFLLAILVLCLELKRLLVV